MTRRTRGPGLLLLSALGLSGCGLIAPDELDEASDDLRAAVALWQAQGIEDYDLTVERLCFCGYVGPVVVEVRDGVRAEVVVPAEYEGPPIGPTAYPDVAELFATIADAIDRDAHRLRVVYHPTLGYPTAISIDYRENVADEELGYEARLKVVDGVS